MVLNDFISNRKQLLYGLAISAVAGYVIILSIIAIPIGSDPGRVWHFSNLFLTQGFGEAFSSLEPSLPVGLNASMMSLLGTQFPLTLVQGICTALIFALISNFVYKRYGLLEAIISLFIFVGSFAALERTTTLTPYPLYLLFLTISILTYIDYLERKSDLFLYLSAIFMAASVYTFNLSISALPIVFIHSIYLLYKDHEWRNKLILLSKFYIPLGVLISPWFLWRYSIAGASFYKNPIHWLGEKYWSKFNIILWKRPAPRSKEYFDYYYKTGVSSTIVSPVMLALGAIGAFKVKYGSVFVIWIITTITSILLGRLPTEVRYLYAILPPLALLGGVSIGYVLRKAKGGMRKTLAISLALLLSISLVHNVQFIRAEHAYLLGVTDELHSLKSFIDPGERIYFRSFQFSAIFPENVFLAPQYMGEADAIDLISWQDEETVQGILAKYDIHWMLLYKDGNQEEQFNGWITLANQELRPNHYIAARSTDLLTEVQTTDNYILYEVAGNE